MPSKPKICEVKHISQLNSLQGFYYYIHENLYANRYMLYANKYLQIDRKLHIFSNLLKVNI